MTHDWGPLHLVGIGRGFSRAYGERDRRMIMSGGAPFETAVLEAEVQSSPDHAGSLPGILETLVGVGSANCAASSNDWQRAPEAPANPDPGSPVIAGALRRRSDLAGDPPHESRSAHAQAPPPAWPQWQATLE